MTNSVTAPPALVLSRTYDAPAHRVYDAWTKPDILTQFLGPGDVKATQIQTDVRVGGRYSVLMVMPDGETLRVGGVYREVQPPNRLSMTWRWEEDDPKDEYDTLLTIEIFERGANRSELVLTHDRFAKVESRENHERGWTKTLGQLAAALPGSR